ncbi:MAG: DUF2179 domain-containing protein [Candidatus Marinimicrobia bacterium]|nr:DUF2179 domain-containing protein [Candidatus Neomarinimicrobiota bacterium]
MTLSLLLQMLRGGTEISGKVFYTRKERNILYTVIARKEVALLRQLVQQIDPDAFVRLEVIQGNMDSYVQMLKNSEKADGQNRIYVAGAKEYEAEEKNKTTVTLQDKVFNTLNDIVKEFGMKLGKL